MNVLLVASASTPDSADLVRRIAPSFDFVIGVDGGTRICVEAGVDVDLIVGDMDSFDIASLPTGTRSPAVEIFPAEKDSTDLELALDAARRNGASSVTVTGAFSGRLDHTLAAVGALLAVPDLQPRLEEPGFRGVLLSAAHRPHEMIGTTGSTVSLIGLSASSVVSITGVRWPLSYHRLGLMSGLGVSNIVTAEAADVTVHEGAVLVIELSE